MSQVFCGYGSNINFPTTDSEYAVASFVVTTGIEHKIIFTPPWEYLANNMNTNILITTGYGMLYITIDKNKNFRFCFFSGMEGIVINNYTVEGNALVIETSVSFNTNLIAFVPVKREYFNSL